MKNYNLVLLVFMYLVVSCTKQHGDNRNFYSHNEAKQDTFYLPERVVIADLPDSLQPRTVLLTDAEKPLTFSIPKKGKRTYSINTPQGDRQRITIEGNEKKVQRNTV